jgi:zinc protease
MSVSARPTRVPVAPPPPRMHPPVAERSSLENGLRILSVERRRLPIADVLLVIPAGAATDELERSGLAHLTAELLDSGSAKRTQIEIATDLDAIGARMSASAGWDHTTIALHSLSPRLPQALGILADVVTTPAFPDEEFRRGRDERLAEILQELDDPDTLADLAIARTIHGRDHVYGVTAAGTRETVARLERDDLVRFHSERYRPASAFAVVAGDIPANDAASLLQDALGAWSSGRMIPVIPPAPAAAKPATIHLLDRPGAPQSEIRIGTVGVPRSSPDYFALIVLNTVLGGSFTSRLNVRMREQGGYTYGAFSGFAFRTGHGPFVAGAAVFTDATDRAIAEGIEEIVRIREAPVPEDELARAKQYVMLGLPRAFETSGGIASRIAEIELHGLDERYWHEFAARVDAIGQEDLRAAARRILEPDRLQVVVVGDASRVRAPLEQLGIAPVVDMEPPR